MTPPKEPIKTRMSAADRRKVLILAALELFEQKGFHATRMEEIAKQAECTTGPLYHFYPTKADIFVGVLEFYTKVSVKRAKSTREKLDDQSPLNRVRASVDFFLDSTQLKLIKMLIRDAPSVLGTDEYNGVVDTLMLDFIESDLRDAMMEGEITPEPPRQLASIFVASILMAYTRSMNEQDLELAKNAIFRLIDRLKNSV